MLLFIHQSQAQAHNPSPFCCAHHRRSLKALQAPGPHVPIPQVAESGQSAAGTLVWLALSPCPHQPWQHRINPPVLAVPGPGSPQLSRLRIQQWWLCWH